MRAVGKRLQGSMPWAEDPKEDAGIAEGRTMETSVPKKELERAPKEAKEVREARQAQGIPRGTRAMAKGLREGAGTVGDPTTETSARTKARDGRVVKEVKVRG